MINFTPPKSDTDLVARERQFVTTTVIPFEKNPRNTAHGPTDERRQELNTLARHAGLLAPHVSSHYGGLGLSHVQRGRIGQPASGVQVEGSHGREPAGRLRTDRNADDHPELHARAGQAGVNGHADSGYPVRDTWRRQRKSRHQRSRPYRNASAHPQFMLGYWKEPEQTTEKIVKSGRHDFRMTGDTGYRDEDGYCLYCSDHIISAAGYRIGPTEVENASSEHPAVLEAVVGKPDAERGEIVKAFIVLRKGFAADAALISALHMAAKSAQGDAP